MSRDTLVAGTASRRGGDVEIDSAVIARGMNMPIGHFMAEMRRGNVHGIVEEGVGEDEGRYRLSFRYRGRELRMIFEGDGRFVGEELNLTAPPRNDGILGLRLRQELTRQAILRIPTTYGRLAERLSFASAKASQRIDEALETLMVEDAREGRPLLSALAVAAVTPGLPAPRFFRRASALGLFAGAPEDVEGYAFHARELRRAILFYARPDPASAAPADPRRHDAREARRSQC